MSENNKITNLKDKQLDKVNGGLRKSNGNCGITGKCPYDIEYIQANSECSHCCLNEYISLSHVNKR